MESIFSIRDNLTQENVDEDVDNAFVALKSWRAKNKDRLTIGNLDMNSIPNKIDDSRNLILDDLDILIPEETKIDDTFSDESIKISDFKHKPSR